MSKVLAVFVSVALLLGAVSVALGDSFVAEARTDSAKLRSGGSMAHHTVATLSSGTRVVVVKRIADWYLVRVPKNVPVYISAKWVRMEADDSGVVAGDRVNLRCSASTKYSAMGTAKRGTVLKVLGKSGSWLKVVPPNEAVGWVYKTHLRRLDSVSVGDVARSEYSEIRKKDDAKKRVVVNEKRLEAMLDASADAIFFNNLDRAWELLDKILADCEGEPTTPSSAKARIWKEGLKKKRELEAKRVADEKKKERKRLDIDKKYHEKMMKILKEEIEKARPKAPRYTAVGTLKGLGLMVLRRGTHMLVDGDGHEMFALRIAPNSGVDLYHWTVYEKKVGVIGTVMDAPGWPQKVIEVRKIVVLEPAKKK